MLEAYSPDMRLEDLLQAFAVLPNGRVLLARRGAAGGWRRVFASEGLAVPDAVEGEGEAPPPHWGGVAMTWRKVALAEGGEVWVGQVAAAEGLDPTELLATLGHELRTPLNGLIGTLGALAREPLTKPQTEMVALMQRSGAGLERLLTDLLDFARLQHGAFPLHPQPFDPAQEIGEAAGLFRPQAVAKGLTFRCTVACPPGLHLLGDALRLRQVVGNLVSNAVKFTVRGEIVVEAALLPDGLEIAVSDTGCGFPPEFQERLFGRYAQDAGAAGRHGGSGLGLSICRALVERMGGVITAQSTPGVGSRFVVRLPAETVAQPEPDEWALGAPTALPGLRALAVDDHPVNRRVLELVLEPMGVQVTLAGSGEEALELLRAVRFDFVLLDLRMPGMDGAMTLKQLRSLEAARRLPPTPVALLSADGRARGVEADAFIPKPITAQGLLEGIAGLLQPRAPAPQAELLAH